MWQIWLIIAGVCLVLEAITVGFFIFWFSIGALITMVASLFIESQSIQLAIFLVSSTLLLFLTKPLVKKLQKNETTLKTNSSSIENQTAKVIKEIDPVEGSGQIKVNGEIWSAKSIDGSKIPEGTTVTIEKIDGVKAIVKTNN